MKVKVTPWSNPAAYCRARGWLVGDRLSGREGACVTVIELRYIGEDLLIARRVRENGKLVQCRESAWSLGCRQWRRVRVSTQRQSDPHG